ncbi:hypothetical protein QNO09_35645 [Streptomyces sp. 378]|uniref:hypothetical protein n=1 Tax=Streptomyces sp. 378 TaxID=3049412 RepID=UPI0024C252C4|nr:hypothetical protein [Streptomyces sp. 378]MDK1348517.1 hypothetical protein [Streptomyces sp. 378]
MLLLVNLQDLLLPVLVGQQNLQAPPLTRRGLLRQGPFLAGGRSPALTWTF